MCSKPKRVVPPFADFFVLVRNFKVLLEGVIALSVVSFAYLLLVMAKQRQRRHLSSDELSHGVGML